MEITELSEQEILRRESMNKLREMGIDPYPAAEYKVTATAAEIRQGFTPEAPNFQDAAIAGRIMSRRIMGSAAFFELQDHTGRIQVYIKRDDVGVEMYNTVFKNCSTSATSSESKGSPSSPTWASCRCTAAN